jgi:hypothetical protein
MQEYCRHFIDDQRTGRIAFGVDQTVNPKQNSTVKGAIDILCGRIVRNYENGSRVGYLKVKIIG